MKKTPHKPSLTTKILCCCLLCLSYLTTSAKNDCSQFQVQFDALTHHAHLNPLLRDDSSKKTFYALLDSIKHTGNDCPLQAADSLYWMARHRFLDSPPDAETISLYKASLPLRKKAVKKDSLFAKTYNNLAAAYLQLMRPDRALSYADSALIHYKTAYNINIYISTVLLRASAQEKLSDYVGAVYELQALENVWGKDKVDNAYLLDWYFSMAEVYTQMDSLDKAIYYYHKILEKNAAYGPEYVFFNLVDLHREKKEFQKAFDYARQIKKYIDTNKRTGLLRSYYSSLGRIKNDSGQQDAALAAHFKALELPITFNVPDHVIYDNIAEVYRNLDQLDKAILYFHKSLMEMIENYKTADALQAPSLDSIGNGFYVYYLSHIVEELSLKSAVLFDLYQQTSNKKHLISSVEHYKALKNLYYNIFKFAYSEPSKLLWTSQAKHSFEKAIEVNFELYEQTEDAVYLNEIFQYAEQSKAIVLQQNLQNLDALNLIPKSIQKELADKKWKIFELETNYIFSKNLAYKEEIQKERRALTNLINELEKNHPQYHEIKYSENKLSISEVQSQLLDKNELILEIFEGENYVYSILIDKQTAKIQRKPKSTQYSNSLETYYQCLSNKDSSLANYKRTARYLYNFFFDGIKIAPYQKLTIIPDGNTAKISFDAFLTDSIDVSLKSASCLIKKVAINYAYAVKTLSTKGTKVKTGKVLVVAPNYSQTELAHLPSAKKEADFIKSKINSFALIGKDATKENCLNAFSSPQSVIHLAMHAERNDNSPLNSQLLFDSNSKLTVNELYNIDLQANLVYLSACHSGAGTIAAGEGVISLARAFKYRGCPNLIMTLWAANDNSGYLISNQFYKNLLDGKDIAQALSSAKLTYLEDLENETFAHPYYWAGIISIGAADRLELKSNSGFCLYFLLGIPFVLFLYLGRGIFHHKN